MSESELKELLKTHKQDHLLQFWSNLDDKEKKHLEKELKAVDFEYVKKLCDTALNELDSAQVKKDEFMEVIPSDHVGKKASASVEERLSWWNQGLKVISENSMAVILLAGGQGTRLGVNYPKGMYNVGLPSGKSLYQLQAERILKLEQLAEEKYGKKCCIKWYIMTSEATLTATREFFESHSYFGLKASQVRFFEQHQLPCLTFEGKLILSSKDSIAKAPDGNGGVYVALKSADIIGDMEKHGVKHVQVYCVDNILVQVADPSFTGFCVQRNADSANKVVEKVDPKECVGVTCLYNGKPKVVEYSEISSTIAEKRMEDGSLLFKDSNICLHYFTVDFLKRIVNDHLYELPHHIAKKKIPYVDSKGEMMKPSTPNGMKLEKFVFDVFQFAENFVVFETDQTQEFSPLKNGPDVPTASSVSCRQDISNLHKKYLAAAGATFVAENGKLESDTIVEISPLVSYAGEGLNKYSEESFTVGGVVELKTDNEKTRSPSAKKFKA